MKANVTHSLGKSTQANKLHKDIQISCTNYVINIYLLNQSELFIKKKSTIVPFSLSFIQPQSDQTPLMSKLLL